MTAGGELAAERKRLDVCEGFGQLRFGDPDLELADARGVDGERAVRQRHQLALGRGVAALLVVLSDFLHGQHLLAADAVDQRRFPHARRTDQHRGIPGIQVGEDLLVAALAHRADDDDREIGNRGPQQGGPRFGVLHEIRLGQQQDDLGPGIRRHGHVAFDAADVQLGSKRREHENDVDVAGEDLFVGFVAGGIAGKPGPPFGDVMDDRLLFSLRQLHGDPVAHDRTFGIVPQCMAEPAGDRCRNKSELGSHDLVAAPVFDGHARRHDSRLGVGLEGVRMKRIPAEVFEGHGVESGMNVAADVRRL